MKEFTVSANVVRAAQVFQAKGDIRYYLNGVFIGKNKTICGTDGAAAFISSHNADIDNDYIIQIPSAIPQPAVELKFMLIDDTSDVLIHCFDRKGKKIKVICGCLIDGDFPDLARVTPDFSEAAMRDAIPTNSLIFQAKYMAKCENLFPAKRCCAMKVTFTGNDSQAIVAEPVSRDYPEGTKVLIMKVRA